VNISEAVKFVLQNRGRKVFKAWSVDALTEAFIQASNSREFVYVEHDGKIVGVLLARAKPAQGELFIREVLTTAPGALKAMLAKFREWYGTDWTITAMRRDYYVRYNTPRLIALLERTA
jgi:hypothetical protein